MAMDDQSSPLHHDELSEWSISKSTYVAMPTGEDSRKFNAVIYGIPNATQEPQDFSDLSKTSVMSLTYALLLFLLTIQAVSSVCLGKYSSDSARPRPVLVKFNSAGYVFNLLYNKKQCKGITVKIDLPLQARKIELLLLKERWQLIQKGQDRKAIRIKGNSIFLAG